MWGWWDGGYDKLPGGGADGALTVDKLSLCPVLRLCCASPWCVCVCVIDTSPPSPVHPGIIGGAVYICIIACPASAVISAPPMRDGCRARRMAWRKLVREPPSPTCLVVVIAGFRCVFFFFSVRAVFSFFFWVNTAYNMQLAHQTGLTSCRRASPYGQLSLGFRRFLPRP